MTAAHAPALDLDLAFLWGIKIKIKIKSKIKSKSRCRNPAGNLTFADPPGKMDLTVTIKFVSYLNTTFLDTKQ
jgi:hypothetical protein